jgi:LuxR family transcriptional regulator, maltose regulon positive regulatory protein
MPLPFQINAQIPRISGTIVRARLLEKLQAASNYKLTLISAPPGYGKTTLAAQFAQQTSFAVAWHTVEEQERDAPSLYAKCVSVLQGLLPGIESLPAADGHSASELAAFIASHLRQHLNGDILYILDDVHNLAGSLAAETWLRTFVMSVPKRCHLILISRILPDLPLTEMIARREVIAIGQQELQFTSQEIHSLANEILGPAHASLEVEEIASRLEGWPAGIVLALQPLPPDLERAMLNGGKGPEALFDALANITLNAQSPKLRSFLLASSTLTRLTPELCSGALGLSDSVFWLEEAQSRSLFLSRTPGGLVYHALFRNFLQRQLKASDPTLFAKLHAHAAQWFADNNQVDEAFEHFISAGEPERSAALSERVAQSYFTQGKLETLLRWGDKLFDAQIQAPRLFLTCAMIHTDRYEYALAESKLEVAGEAFTARKDRKGASSVQLQRAMTSLQNGNYLAAAQQAERLIERAELSDDLRGRALNILGVAELHLGQSEATIQHLEAALPLYRMDGDAYALSQLLQNLEAAYTRVGRLDDAGACLQEEVALRRSLNSAGALALALNNLGYYYHLRSNYRQAMATFQEGLSVAVRVQERRAESYLLWSLGDLQRDQGAFEDALRLYDSALELLGNSEPSLRASILISESILKRWQRRYEEALAYAEEACEVASTYQLALEATVSQTMIAAASALGDDNRAMDALRMSENELREQGAKMELLRTLGIEAVISLKCSNLKAMGDFVRSGLALAQDAGSAQPLVAELFHSGAIPLLSASHSALYRALASELKSLQEAQSKSHSLPRSNSLTAQTTYRLRILTLGQEVIERDGSAITTSEWRATAAREMLLYLLFVGPQSREDFSLAFWPESEAKNVRSNFHTTLYRARHALGENVIIFQNGLYLINPEVDIHADAAELKSLTAQARLMPSRDARTEDLWRQAVALYRGDFLPSLDTEWVLPIREIMRETYIDALMGLSECARIRGDLREALALLKQAVGVDPYREDIHRAIMTCYAERGEKKKVLVHLVELQQLLWQELAVKPSSETIALVDSLLH